MKIGERLIELRNEHGITQKELADVLNVTAQAISRWENEQTYPDVELLPRIADFYNVSIDSLFVRNEEEQLNMLLQNYMLTYDSAIFDKAVNLCNKLNDSAKRMYLFKLRGTHYFNLAYQELLSYNTSTLNQNQKFSYINELMESKYRLGYINYDSIQEYINLYKENSNDETLITLLLCCKYLNQTDILIKHASEFLIDNKNEYISLLLADAYSVKDVDKAINIYQELITASYENVKWDAVFNLYKITKNYEYKNILIELAKNNQYLLNMINSL